MKTKKPTYVLLLSRVGDDGGTEIDVLYAGTWKPTALRTLYKLAGERAGEGDREVRLVAYPELPRSPSPRLLVANGGFWRIVC